MMKELYIIIAAVAIYFLIFYTDVNTEGFERISLEEVTKLIA